MKIDSNGSIVFLKTTLLTKWLSKLIIYTLQCIIILKLIKKEQTQDQDLYYIKISQRIKC